MLLIWNVLAAAVSRKQSTKRSKTLATNASSNLCTGTSEAYYMALNYATLETNRCLHPNAGSMRCCAPMG